MSEWLAVILLGIIEGVTEFLPVSSTGHLQIFGRWLEPQSELFDIVIQCGAVLAVMMVFQARVRSLVRDWRAPAARDYTGKLLFAFGITVAGVLLAERLGISVRKDDMAPAAWTARVAWATLIGGVLIVVIERWNRNRTGQSDISWLVAAAAGVAQILAAVYPGTSRSGATILFAVMLGVARPAATEFSFLLGVPTLLSAGGYMLLRAAKAGELGDEHWGQVLLGTAVASVMAFIVVKWLLRYVQTHTFTVFGWYRIGLAAVIFALLARE